MKKINELEEGSVFMHNGKKYELLSVEVMPGIAGINAIDQDEFDECEIENSIMVEPVIRLTEMQAIEACKQELAKVSGENWVFSLMNADEADEFIYGYLNDYGLQYLTPISYGYHSIALCHQDI